MFTTLLLSLFLAGPSSGVSLRSAEFAIAHPDHGAPFPEQLAGQWWLEGEAEGSQQRLRFYEDGRFAFFSGKQWTAGSYFILRSNERDKGVLRLEYYLDGNLHFEEIRCEIHFEVHENHGTEEEGDHHDHGGEGEPTEEHHHEYLKVEVLPAAEQGLDMSGEYLHVH